MLSLVEGGRSVRGVGLTYPWQKKKVLLNRHPRNGARPKQAIGSSTMSHRADPQLPGSPATPSAHAQAAKVAHSSSPSSSPHSVGSSGGNISSERGVVTSPM